jgi:hypothetical protein
MGIPFSKMPPKCFCYIKWPANTLESSAPAFADSLETTQAVSHPCLSSLSSYVHMSAARFGFLWWSRALYLHICSLYMKYMLFLPLQSSLGKSPSVICKEISWQCTLICQLRYQFTSIFSQLVVDTKPFTSKSILNFCSQAKIQGDFTANMSFTPSCQDWIIDNKTLACQPKHNLPVNYHTQ